MRRLAFKATYQAAYPGFLKVYRHLIDNEQRSREDLVREQEASLREIISFAYERVPYYRRLFDSLSLKPSDISQVEDLQKLPVLTKNIIRANWEDFKPSNLSDVPYLDKGTGGSTGTPLQYRISKYDQMISMAMLYRGWGFAGYQLGDRVVLMGGSSLTLGVKSSLSKKFHETLKNIRMLSSFDMGEQEMDDYSSTINSFKPRFVFGYASSLYFFSNWLERHGREIHSPKAVFTTAEKLMPHMREKIESVFGCDVLDTYGLNDGGVSAFECPEKRGMHIDMERSVLEVVDDRGTQLGKGEGLILATSLHNHAMPFIRYDTGDIGVVADEPCPCGRPFPLLSEIKGRQQEMLITPEGRAVHGEFFTHIFWDVKGVREFQVVQDGQDHLLIRIVPEVGFDRGELDRIREVIKGRSHAWVVDFEELERIDRTRSGKFKFVINEVGA